MGPQFSGDELKAVKKRSEKAFIDCLGHSELVDEVYRFILPMRKPAETKGVNDRRQTEIFDGTAPRAAFRFAGRLSSEFTPPFQKFFELKAGPAIPKGPGRKKLDEDLTTVSTVVKAQIDASNFDVSSQEAYLDLFCGDMALLMLETGEKGNPTHYVAVPSKQVAIRRDGFGRKTGIYWKAKFILGDLPYLWDETKSTIDADLQKKIDKNPDDEVEIVQASEFDRKNKIWKFRAFVSDGKHKLFADDLAYCNWLVPSFWQVPGEPKGRGPGMVALGPVKVANKLQEFSLKNAAFALLGLWMYRDDGAFRVANAPITPGAFWKVASTGGPFGPSIAKLPMAERFDVSMFVLEQIQMQIKQATLDDTLPPDTGAVRSATEIVERMKRLAADWAGAFSRLQRDFLRPLIEWNIWVASKNGTLPYTFKIDEVLVKLEIVSPVARGDQAAAVENEVKWIELLATLFGQQAMMLMARVEEIGPGWGRKLGVNEKLIRSEDEKTQLMALAQQLAAMMVAQEKQAGGAQPTAAAA